MSASHSILFLPKYISTPSSSRTAAPLHFAPGEVVGDFYLFKVKFEQMQDIIEFVDPYMDSIFVENACRPVDSGHPDVSVAWINVWHNTWLDSCSVQITGFPHHGVGVVSRVDNGSAVFEEVVVPLWRVSRIYAPGHQLVIVMGRFCGYCTTVISQPDSQTLIVTVVAGDFDLSTAEHTIKPEYTLDYASFSFLLDAPVVDTKESTLVPTKWDGPALMTLAGTEHLLGHNAFVVRGYKGYHGNLQQVTLSHAFVKLPGISDGSRVLHVKHGSVMSSHVHVVFHFSLFSFRAGKLVQH